MTEETQNTDSKTLNPLPWIVGVLLVLGLAVLAGIYWNRTGKIKDVQYKGFNYTTEQALKQVEIPTGIHPDSVDISGIIHSIEQIPYVKQARISTSPGGTMTVDITEREPIAMLINGSQRAYVDADGIRLPHVLGKTPDVPLLYGFNAKPASDTLQSEGFMQASAFLQELRQRKAADATISEIAWNSSEGIIALTNENGVKLVFGNGEYSDRLRNWEAFYREVVRQKGIANIQTVDLRFDGQIVTREQ